MAEVFEGQEELQRDHQAREQLREAERVPSNFEPAEMTRARAQLARDDLGPEPTDEYERVLWNVRHRLRCDDADCTSRYGKRMESLSGVPEGLERVVATGTPLEQQEALRLIGSLGIESKAMVAANRLASPNEGVRLEACRSLHWLRSPEVTSPLLDRLSRTQAGDERRCLIRALKGRPGEPALLSLGAAALRPMVDEALAAVASLKGRDDRQSVAVLEKAVHHAATWTVRRSAVEALADLQSPDARRALSRASRSKDSQVRELARRLEKD